MREVSFKKDALAKISDPQSVNMIHIVDYFFGDEKDNPHNQCVLVASLTTGKDIELTEPTTIEDQKFLIASFLKIVGEDFASKFVSTQDFLDTKCICVNKNNIKGFNAGEFSRRKTQRFAVVAEFENGTQYVIHDCKLSSVLKNGKIAYYQKYYEDLNGKIEAEKSANASESGEE